MSLRFANGFLQSSTPATLQTFDAQGFATRKKCLKFLTRPAERRLRIIGGPSRKIKCQQCLRCKFAQSLQSELEASSPGFSLGVHNEFALHSGFPLECYRRAFINGQRVNVFHGDNTQGLYQPRMMENACIALVTAGATILTIEALRRRRASSVKLKATMLPDATRA